MPFEDELVFAMVGPLGVDLPTVTSALTQVLGAAGYTSTEVRLTDCLRDEGGSLGVSTHHDEYVDTMQKAGHNFRKKYGRRDAIALAAVRKVQLRRQQLRASAGAAATKPAFILRQLKTPEEVITLRKIYGSRFVLLGLYDTNDRRAKALAGEIATSRGDSSRSNSHLATAYTLINCDMSEEDEFGQNVRDTYPLADVFIDCGDVGRIHGQIRRFVELLFGAPFLTPTPEEYLMFLARAVALRSSDLSRQVGAAITTTAGSVIAVGMNEVPKVGGGAYGEGDSPDNRDFKSKTGRDQQMKRETLQEVLIRLRNEEWLEQSQQSKGVEELVTDALGLMKGTRLLGLGEFQRVVHAEMMAVTDAARRGVPIEGTVLFTTTFPCQNCAKHLIGAGIRAIIYMEPYPKSLTAVLHEAECEQQPMTTLRDLEGQIARQDQSSNRKVLLCAYIGLAPRLYQLLFAMPTRKGTDGNPVQWRLDPAKRPRLTTEHDQHRIAIEETLATKLISGLVRQ